MKVKFLGMDDRGKVRLSMKVVDQETGEDISEKIRAEREAERAARGETGEDDREDRGDRRPPPPASQRGVSVARHVARLAGVLNVPASGLSSAREEFRGPTAFRGFTS